MICPYCREGFASPGRLAPWECARCRTPVHAECAASHRGCVTYGCVGVEWLPGRVPCGPTALAPRLGARIALRAGARATRELVVAPSEPLALAVLALLGVAALALQA